MRAIDWLVSGSGTVAASLVLVACGEGLSSSDSHATEAGFTVNSIEKAFVSRALGPALPVVVIDLTLENTGTYADTIRFDASQFDATDGASRTYRPVRARGTKICDDPDYAEPALEYGKIEPGEAIRGAIVFAVEPGATLERLTWDKGTTGRVDAVTLPGARVRCEP